MPHQLPPIDDDVFAALQPRAEPLVDDINSVLRRLLGLDSKSAPGDEPSRMTQGVAGRTTKQDTRARKRKPRREPKARPRRVRAPRGALLPDVEYELPVLEALEELGGRASSREVIDLVGAKLQDKLQDVDREPITSGEVRWRNRVQFVRLRLIQAGDMEQGSQRGIWEISDQGRQRVKGTGHE